MDSAFIVLHLPISQIVLKYIKSLIADDKVESEDLLMGLPGLHHLRIDTKKQLEENIHDLNGTNCSFEDTQRKERGRLERLMNARLNRQEVGNFAIFSEANANRPRINCHTTQKEEDQFPDPSLLDHIDADQHKEIKSSVGAMLKLEKDNGLSNKEHKHLEMIVFDHMEIFFCSFLSRPSAKLPPLKIEPTADAKPVEVRWQTYSADQRKFSSFFVKNLVKHGMAYPNPRSK